MNCKQFIVAGALSLLSSQAFASAFFLHEQNASQLGGFYAGAAAVAEDASTNFWNPAGLTQLGRMNVVASGVNVSTYGDFKGTTTLTQGANTKTETGKASNGSSRLVPAVHGAMHLSPKMAVGLSVSAPFGLSTIYEEDSIARYQATKSELVTINIAPSIAYQFTDWFSFGVGFDAQYAEAEINAVLGSAAIPGTVADSRSTNKANDWGFGWHAGVLFIVPQTGTHLGLAFHSDIEQNLSGTSKLIGPANPTNAKSRVKGDARLPWWMVASAYHEINEMFSVLGSVEYFHWSSISKLELRGVQAGNGATATSTDPLNYDNSWTFTGAFRARMNEAIMFSIGGGYDQTPTNSTDRDLRVPDADRWIASAGVRWNPQAAKNVQLDVGYAHIFPDKAKINKTIESTTQTTTAVGDVQGGANLVGAQFTLNM